MGMAVPIIGRRDELAQLRAALIAATRGAGRLVLVSGEPGIGKTRLATAVTDMAGEYDLPAASGYAIDDPGMPPLWPCVKWAKLSRPCPVRCPPRSISPTGPAPPRSIPPPRGS